MELRDRAIGSVLGLTLGDALGAPFEFRRRDRIPSPLPAFDLPWMGLAPGTGTDDTAMARILVRSLIAHGGDLDAMDVRSRLVDWLGTDPPDVGTLTRRVLTRVREGVDDAAREYVEQRGPEVSAGNGSVMYCAPLGVAYAHRPDRLETLAPELSAITHWDERCRTSCLAVTLAVAALVRGEPASHAVAAAVAAVAELEGGEELEYLVQEAGRARPVDGPDMGFTLFTAGLALRVAAEAHDVESGLRHVVSLGGDTDTNAAVAGALLGAVHGRAGLPETWLRSLVDRAAIEAEAERLAEVVDHMSEGPITQWDRVPHGSVPMREGDVAMPMQPNEIFELIIKADEKLKYAKPGAGDVRAKQAGELLSQAKAAAEEIGNDALLQQVTVRQADLDALFAAGGEGAGADSSAD